MYRTVYVLLLSALFPFLWAGSLTGDGAQQKIADFGDEDEAYLNNPTKVLVNQHDEVLILDSGESQILVFQPGGALKGTIGRKGSGPGEFAQAVQMALDPKGGPVVYDFMAKRFVFFHADGTFNRFQSFPKFVWHFAIAPNGTFVVETRDLDFNGKKGGTKVQVHRYDRDLGKATLLKEVRIFDNKSIAKPVPTNIPQPFHDELFWGMLPDGSVVTANSGNFHVQHFSPQGKPAEKLHLKGKRAPVGDEDKQAFLAQMAEFSDDQTVPGYVRKAIRWPDYKPYFGKLYITEQNKLLFETHLQRNGPDGRKLYYRLSEGKADLEEIWLPPLGNGSFHGNTFYRMEQDAETASRRVISYRIF